MYNHRLAGGQYPEKWFALARFEFIGVVMEPVDINIYSVYAWGKLAVSDDVGVYHLPPSCRRM